jgi:DNA polymerase I
MQQVLFSVMEEKPLWWRSEGCKYYIVDTEARVARLAEILSNKEIIAYDIETTGLDLGTCEIVGVSICAEEGLGFYIPLGHKYGRNLSLELFKKYLKEILETKSIIGHNLKFDYKFTLFKYGITLNCVHDTFVMVKLLDYFDYAGLKFLGESIFGFDVLELSDMIAEYNIGYDKLNLLTAEELFEYCCQDTDLTLRLYNYLLKEFKWKDTFLYKEEMKLVTSLGDMENRGVKIDFELLKSLKVEYEQEVLDIEIKMREILGVHDTFNINSDEKFSTAAASRFPGMKSKYFRTEKKAVRMDKDSVKKYKEMLDEQIENHKIPDDHNVFDLHLERKSKFSLLSKYIYNWIEMIEERKSTTIYTNFNAFGARTGRMSSDNPNMQNIAPKMRHCIIPRKGYYFLSMDYDQVEYRILAVLAGLDHLVEDMNKDGADIHTLAAMLIFGKTKEEIKADPSLRTKAKTLNFGIVYGMGDHKLAKALGISIDDAEALKRVYNERFLRGTGWFDRVVDFAKDKGYVLTSFGRKRRIPNIDLVIDKYAPYKEKKELTRLLESAKRVAVNSPIQGTSADITKMGCNNVDAYIKEHALDIWPVLVIHDDIVFEVSDKYSPEEAIAMLKPQMEMKFKGKVNLTVDNNVSTVSWGAMKG